MHCRANRAIERYHTRHQRDGTSVDELAPLMARVEAEQHRVVYRLSLGCPCLEVDTSDGYDPSLAELLRALRPTTQ